MDDENEWPEPDQVVAPNQNLPARDPNPPVTVSSRRIVGMDVNRPKPKVALTKLKSGCHFK
jgi:hypothetical protein